MQKISFNRHWRFNRIDPPAFLGLPGDTEAWRQVDLPHDWSIELERQPSNPSSNLGGYFPTGLGYYVRQFDAPVDWQGKRVWIEFEGVYMNAEVWVNEYACGVHPYGYTSFYYDLTPHLKVGETNRITVLVDNSHPLNARWYSGSGIYRPVWLLVAEPVHIAHWGVCVSTPDISPESARILARSLIENDSPKPQRITLSSRLISPDQNIVAACDTLVDVAAGSRSEVAQEFLALDPLFWSPDAPHRYQLVSDIHLEGALVDTNVTSFGIRSLEFSPEKGFILNGQVIKLKGGCVHHDNGILGAASYRRSEERKVEILKASGFNAIRCAHNPPAPDFLEACDRLGMLVIDEAFDVWREGKNPGDYHLYFEDWWQRDLESMLLRDRNHPCIFLWSIGNELIERGKPQGAELARRLAERVRQLDPTRPVTAAICDGWKAWPWEQTAAIFAELDVCGYNYQFKQYASDHARFPQRIMVGTESAPKEAFDNWMLVQEHPFVLGDFVWTSLDYLGESGIGREVDAAEDQTFLPGYPWHQANCGDLDLCGFKRPQSYYRDMLWGSGEPLYIGVHTPLPEGKKVDLSYWGWPDIWPNWSWPGREGEIFPVEIYSTCESVELQLNGRSLGIKPTTQVQRFMTTFNVPYEPGELKAIGYTGGKVSASKVLHTCSAPVAIRLRVDRPTLPEGEGELAFVVIEIVDRSGRVHPSAENEVELTIDGPGRLAAFGNSNPLSRESYIANHRQAYRGRLLAAVLASGEAGEIRLRATSAGLEPEEFTIQVK